MKNLFYVCLVAMLSLGSTGFTTVEEMEDPTSDLSEMNCFEEAWAAWDEVYSETENWSQASDMADHIYFICTNWIGGSPGSQEPVLVKTW